MGILRSVALGKSRKSAGELTFYNRIGVACFRQKPTLSPGYKPSVPQRMQQSVFRFFKKNMDAAGLKPFIDTFYDAKPRKGKSETVSNMFYREFMPHVVAEKAAVYALSDADQISPALFLGTPETNRDRLTQGQLGDMTILSGSAESMTMAASDLDQIIAKANTLISSNDTPFTIDNVFVGVFGAAPGTPTGYRATAPTAITPTLADGVYTFDISTLASGLDINVSAYAVLLIAGKTTEGQVDITRRKFATSSAMLNGGPGSEPVATIASASSTAGNNYTIVIPTDQLTSTGVKLADLQGCKHGNEAGDAWGGTDGVATEAGGNTSITFKASNVSNIQVINSRQSVLQKVDNSVIVALTNDVDWSPTIE